MGETVFSCFHNCLLCFLVEKSQIVCCRFFWSVIDLSNHIFIDGSRSPKHMEVRGTQLWMKIFTEGLLFGNKDAFNMIQDVSVCGCSPRFSNSHGIPDINWSTFNRQVATLVRKSSHTCDQFWDILPLFCWFGCFSLIKECTLNLIWHQVD